MAPRLSQSTLWILAAWLLLVGSYAAVATTVSPGPELTAFGDIAQCVVPLFANAGLLMSAASPNWRRNTFWMLLALGCSLWMVGQLQWTYIEIYLKQPVPNPFVGDIIVFLHTVPMIAALALQPHSRQPDRNLRFGYLDFTLLLLWWVYLYLFIVIPWQYVMPDVGLYGHSYIMLYIVENMVFLPGLGILWMRTTGRWRTIYAHLFGAACCYTMSSLVINVAINQNAYHTGSLYDIPLVASFVWFGTAGIVGCRLGSATDPAPSRKSDEAGESAGPWRYEGVWTARLAMVAVFSLPALALWSLLFSAEPAPVRQFRLLVTLAAKKEGPVVFGIRLKSFIWTETRRHILHQVRPHILLPSPLD